jgi:site-specific DNA recombinase
MIKNYFKGIIKCQHCNKNYIRKTDHGTAVFICSTANNYGKQTCPQSRRIKEEEIIKLISRHCEIYNKDYTIEKTKLFVRKIEVAENILTIFYKDGTKTLISPNQIIF